MNAVRDFKIQLNPGNTARTIIYANQYDSGEKWRFTIYDQNGSQYSPSSAIITGVTVNNMLITRDAEIENGKVIVTETKTMTQTPGMNEFRLELDGGEHATANFCISVEARPSKVFLAEHDMQVLEDAIEAGANVKALTEQIETNAEDIIELRAAVGTPLVSETAAGMINTNKIYVYTGNESGFTYGHWYYWDGTEWTDGGIYNSTAFNTDATLSVSGSAADAKAAGDAIFGLSNSVENSIENGITEAVGSRVLVFKKGGIIKTSSVGSVGEVDTSYTDWAYALAPVNPGDRVVTHSWATSSLSRHVAFYDEDMKVISRTAGMPDGGEYTLTIDAPEGAAYIGVNNNVEEFPYGYYGYINSQVQDQQVKIDDLIREVKTMSGIDRLALTKGCYYNTSGSTIDISSPTTASSSDSASCCYVECSEGDEFLYTGRGMSNARGWAFIDSLGNILDKSTTDAFVNSIVEAPENSAYAIFNFITPATYGNIVYKGVLSEKENKNNFFKGKKLSIIGDSFSAYAGDIPSGNIAYYNGTNRGVSSKMQMWYRIVCQKLGMELLVNNSFSGTCVTPGVREGHDSLIPGSDPRRCENLGTLNDDPDIVILEIGTNDYHFMTPTGPQFGTWDGKTPLGQQADMSDYDVSTFRTAYATMLARIRRKYPKALIFCGTTVFTNEKDTDTGVTYLNAIGKTYTDYGDAIIEIADIMGCRTIDLSSVGFNRYNYTNIGTYAGDLTEEGTHPNAKGHKIVADAVIWQLLNGSWAKHSGAVTYDLAEEINGDISELDDTVTALINDHPVNTVTGNPAVAEKALGVNAKGLVVDFAPIQDLHGYDKPWVGGAGKNLLPLTVAGLKTANTGGTWNGNAYTVNGVTFTIQTDADGNVTGINVNGTATADISFYLTSRISTSSFASCKLVYEGSAVLSNDLYANIRYYAQGGSAISNQQLTSGTQLNIVIPDTAETLVMSIFVRSAKSISNALAKLMICLQSVTDTSWEPYSNICPISGRDSVSVNRTGHNIWDEEWVNGQYQTSNGEILPGNNVCCKNRIPILPNTTYFFKSASVTGGCFLFYYGADGSYLSGGISCARNTAFTTPENAYYMTFYEGASYGTTYNNDISINYPATFTAYEPYRGESVTIPFGETVYGGTLDVTNGVLTVTHGIIVADGSADENWQHQGNVDGKTLFRWQDNLINLPNYSKDYLCDMFQSGNASSATGTVGSYIFDKMIRFRVPVSCGTTVGEFRPWLTNNPITIYVPLATPTTITLTPAQVKLLQGLNYITEETGTPTVEYFQSVAEILSAMEEAIPGSIAPVEGDTASTNYAVGSYLMHNDTLYKVIAAITTGETLAAGTNIQATTIMAELVAKTS